MQIKIYTDASFNDRKKISSCGFIIIKGKKIINHQVLIYEKIDTNTQAEIYAAYLSLLEAYELPDITNVVLFTDCQTVHHLINKVIGKCKGDLHKELLEVVKAYKEAGIGIKSQKVKAHSCNKYNTMIDISVRKYLREVLL